MSDKRKVSTDALETLGMIHTRDEKRDAIHIAVLPATAGQNLRPGTPAKVSAGVAFKVSDVGDATGIVDPFLTSPVLRGQRFWFLVMPRTIQSLRHVWSHPAFPDEATAPGIASDGGVAAAKAAIHEVAADLGVSDERLMAGAKEWLGSNGWDGYMCFGEDLSYNWDMPAFWAAYSLLTGEPVPPEKQTSFFRCAC